VPSSPIDYVSTLHVLTRRPELLDGRFARCTCGMKRPSSLALEDALAFFEYRGPESREAKNGCGTCRYMREAHERKIAHPEQRHLKHVCDDFTPLEHEYDSFYCGHKGWD